MMEKTMAFLDENKDKPFFLYFPSPLPHVSLQAPDEYVKKHIGKFEESRYYGNAGYASTKYPLGIYDFSVTVGDFRLSIFTGEIY